MPAKKAGYLKSPYQANFAGVRRRPPASADAPRGSQKLELAPPPPLEPPPHDPPLSLSPSLLPPK